MGSLYSLMAYLLVYFGELDILNQLNTRGMLARLFLNGAYFYDFMVVFSVANTVANSGPNPSLFY